MSDTSHGTNADDGQFNPLIPEGPPPGEDREATSSRDAENSRVDTTSIDPRSDPPQTDEDGEPIDDGMGANDEPDAAGEDEPVPGIDE